MVRTASDVIAGALRLIGVIDPLEAPGSADQATALQALNDMLAGWATERLAVYAAARQTVALTPGKASYTIGQYPGSDLSPGVADIDTARPVYVDRAFVRDLQGLDSPIEVISRQRYADVSDKTTQAQPEWLYLEPGYPFSTVYLYPVPDTSESLYLDLWQPFAEIAAAANEIRFPAEYARALKYNLAVEISPEYGSALRPAVVAIAEKSKRDLKRVNFLDRLQAVKLDWQESGHGYKVMVE